MNQITDAELERLQEQVKAQVPTILLVDDDQEVRQAMRAVLEPHFAILEAENGAYALGMLSEFLPDLVISDISMPDMDGVTLLREIRARDLDIPVILVTGEPHIEDAMQAVEYGALRYLEKPVDPDELIGVVEAAAGFGQMASAKRKAYRITSGSKGTASDFAGQVERFERALHSLYLHFQPIWSVHEQRPVGYECLLRCAEPSLSSPPDLIREAEELGRVHEVGRAIRAFVMSRMHEVPGNVRLFVNLHYSDLNDPELFDANSIFTQSSDRIVLEITERESLEAIANAQDKVSELRGLGFRIAMDDLGAGHNGLAAFVRLAPEVVKLDMALVRNVHREENKHELVKVMRDYCDSHGMEIIAEGVESRGEMDSLVDIGVDLFQGYFIAKPGNDFAVPPDPCVGDGDS